MILIAEATEALTIPGGGYTVATLVSALVASMIWYMRHTTVKTIPSLAKEHRDMTKEIIDDNRSQVNMLIVNFRSDLMSEREARESGRDKDREVFREGIHAIKNEQAKRALDDK